MRGNFFAKMLILILGPMVVKLGDIVADVHTKL
jgi:hypothetical protein